ncbi:MAG TPA: hypothetical protein VFW57_07455 [Acidimicrobiia bacterium]|nr:hypothetical protein [Acidimicrobiia bacterium]
MLVLLVSFLLVIVATIFLLSGLFLTDSLGLIFVSIACSALAGIVLVLAVMKSKPRPSTTPAADGEGEVPVGVAEESSAGRQAPARRAESREFPIDEYDSLEVVEVLPLLGDLEPAQLEMVRQREASGRAHPWILARVDALLEAEADADTSEHAWAPGPIGTSGQQRSLLDDEDDIVEVEPDDADWATPRESDWAASDFPLDSGSDYDDLSGARDFPIDRYDQLRVSEILPLLTNLGAEDLKMVREEETAGKARASILARIDGLLGRSAAGSRTAAAKRPAGAAKKAAPSKAAANLPIEDYDNLNVAQIVARLMSLSPAELRQVRTYEKRHKNRAGVLTRIDGALRGR